MHHVQCGAAGVNGLLIAALTALTHADRPRHRRAAVPAMRCSASCSTRANGAASCGAATLDLMQAAWLSQVPTRTAAERAASRIAAVVSTEISTNMVVSASVVSVRCHSHAPRASRAVRSRWREWAADCRPYGLDARRSAAAPKGGLATSRAPAACCSVPLACTACITCSAEPLA